MRSIGQALDALPPQFQKLAAAHFDGAARRKLEAWSERLAKGASETNRVSGLVEPPHAEDITPAPATATAEGAAALERGRNAIARGEVGFVVLAGGMATRMGGVVKGLVEAIPGLSFLAFRAREIDRLRVLYGGRVPLWLMTSFATHAPIDAALSSLRGERTIATFQQDISLRLTPSGELFRLVDGLPSIYATGHGDLPDALRRSGLLDSFIAGGGRTLWIANIDNLGATIDPAILGWHLGHGAPLSVELVDKVGSDRGGIPARLDGRPVVLEEFRLPRGFDPSKVRTFNTNTFIVEAQALRDSTVDFRWTYFEVRKKVETRDAVQFERLLGELTSVLETRFVKVPRDGLATRFLPVKDGPELEARRPELLGIARDRGIVV